MAFHLDHNHRVGAAVLMALQVWCCSVAAQTNLAAVSESTDSNPQRATKRGSELTLTGEYSAVAARGVSFNGVSGHSGAQAANASVTAAVPLNDRWFVPLGLSSRNVFLGTVAGAPIPDQIDTLAFRAGLGYHVDDQWTVEGTVGPRVYLLDDVDSNDISVGGTLRATYRWKPNLTLALGLSVEPDRDVPVLPAAGLRWDVRTNLTLNLMFPRSRVDYRVTPRLTLFLGGDGVFTVFRADNNLGTKIGQPQFNNGLGTYRDFRLGLGAEYRLIRGLTGALETGYSFAREIHYKRIDETVKFGSAPFIQVGLRWRL